MLHRADSTGPQRPWSVIPSRRGRLLLRRREPGETGRKHLIGIFPGEPAQATADSGPVNVTAMAKVLGEQVGVLSTGGEQVAKEPRVRVLR